MSRGRKACMDRLAGQKKNMAASNIDSLTDESKEKIILTENDIPGAKIPRESLEHCSVPQLKRWLLCRGAKTTGKKAALIARYVIKVLPLLRVRMCIFLFLALDIH